MRQALSRNIEQNITFYKFKTNTRFFSSKTVMIAKRSVEPYFLVKKLHFFSICEHRSSYEYFDKFQDRIPTFSCAVTLSKLFDGLNEKVESQELTERTSIYMFYHVYMD